MTKKTIFLIHAQSKVPKEFSKRMCDLRELFGELSGPNLCQIKFSAYDAEGGDSYVHLLSHLRESDLVVMIMDHPFDEQFMVVHERCCLGLQILCVCSREDQVPKVVSDCLNFCRSKYTGSEFEEFEKKQDLFPLPMICVENEELVSMVVTSAWALSPNDYFFHKVPPEISKKVLAAIP